MTSSFHMIECITLWLIMKIIETSITVKKGKGQFLFLIKPERNLAFDIQKPLKFPIGTDQIFNNHLTQQG